MIEINIFRHSAHASAFESGEVVFREGDAAEAMFAVVEGEVELRHGGTILEAVGPGGIFGEMALIEGTARSATATALTPARIVRVDHEQFTYLVQDHPTFAIQVMTVMAERLRKANG